MNQASTAARRLGNSPISTSARRGPNFYILEECQNEHVSGSNAEIAVSQVAAAVTELRREARIHLRGMCGDLVEAILDTSPDPLWIIGENGEVIRLQQRIRTMADDGAGRARNLVVGTRSGVGSTDVRWSWTFISWFPKSGAASRCMGIR